MCWDDFIIWLKIAYFTISGWILSVFLYFTPMHWLWVCILATWIGNLVFGYLSGLVLHNEKLDTKKFLWATVEVVVYLLVTALFFFIGDRMKNQSLIVMGLTVVTWAFLYFYAVNILKNIVRLLPRSLGFKYLYFVLSLEFIKRIPYMKEFQKQEHISNHGEESSNTESE